MSEQTTRYFLVVDVRGNDAPNEDVMAHFTDQRLSADKGVTRGLWDVEQVMCWTNEAEYMRDSGYEGRDYQLAPGVIQ